jgi:hypothetical protein
MWTCLSFEPYDVERLEQLGHFTLRSVLVITWFTLPYLSQSLSLNHLSSQSLFSSRLIFLVVVHSQEVPIVTPTFYNNKFLSN